MDILKTQFMPNISMENNMIATHFCPMCGQQFESAQHAAEHIQLCHGVISSGGGGILVATAVNDPLRIDYPCPSCDEKFSTAQQLDEHHRLTHQTAAFLARCLACGIYGISATSLQVGDEYKCMHCGAICTAASLSTGPVMPAAYIQQPDPPHTPEELPSIPPENMNQMNPEETNRNHHQHHQQQQQHIQQMTTNCLQQQQQQQTTNDQQQQTETLQQQMLGLKVPPLKVRLNSDGSGETVPQVTIKEEPIGHSDNVDNDIPNSAPVYAIQSPNTNTVVNVTNIDSSQEAQTQTGTLINRVRHKCSDCPKTFKTPGTLAMHRKIHTGETE